MSKKRIGIIIGIIAVLVVAGIAIWAVQNNKKLPDNDTEQVATNPTLSLPDSNVDTALPDDGKTSKQPETTEQTPEEFLRTATNYDGTGKISLNMTKERLRTLLKESNVLFNDETSAIIAVGEKKAEINYIFQSDKLFRIMFLGPTGSGIQGIKVGDTVADMKKILGSNYTSGLEANDGPAYFYYKTGEDVLLIVYTKGVKQKSKIDGLDILIPSAKILDGIYNDIYNSL